MACELSYLAEQSLYQTPSGAVACFSAAEHLAAHQVCFWSYGVVKWHLPTSDRVPFVSPWPLIKDGFRQKQKQHDLHAVRMLSENRTGLLLTALGRDQQLKKKQSLKLTKGFNQLVSFWRGPFLHIFFQYWTNFRGRRHELPPVRRRAGCESKVGIERRASFFLGGIRDA